MARSNAAPLLENERSLEVEDVDHDVGLFVQKDDVAADEKLSTIRGRRRQLALEFLRARIELLLQTRGERAIANELPFKARRQLISLGKTGREVGLALIVPPANFLFVGIVVAVGIAIIVVIAVMLIVAVPVAVAMTVARKREHRTRMPRQAHQRRPVAKASLHSPEGLGL